MPCNDWGGPSPTYADPDGLDKKQRDARTRLACDRIKWLRRQGRRIPEWAASYVEFHDEQDQRRIENETRAIKDAARRKAQEKLRASALQKLTAAELKALGIRKGK